jgi:hypothetical protein
MKKGGWKVSTFQTLDYTFLWLKSTFWHYVGLDKIVSIL